MISERTIELVKASANIVDVVGEFTTLKKRGVDYDGLCPFHEDRREGSFKVSPSKNICSCFACETGALDPIAFVQKKLSVGFSEAVRWLASRYNIECEGSEKYAGKTYERRTPAMSNRQILDINPDWVRPTLKNINDNTLVKWIKSLPWTDQMAQWVDPILKMYCVGHFKEGHTMFWQIDHECKVRTGKMMLYKPDGHRDKETQHNFDWIHAWLARNKWYDTDKYEYNTCYFGSHLIKTCPNATINLVESEKTALICAIAYGNPQEHLWIATGGMQFFNLPKMQPLIAMKRHVVLYPDLDGEQRWKEKAKEIGYEHLSVNTDWMHKHWLPEDGEKADIADVIVRMLKPKQDNIAFLKEESEAMKFLIDKLDLYEDNQH